MFKRKAKITSFVTTGIRYDGSDVDYSIATDDLIRTLELKLDESMETEIYANIRFINFLDYPERVPDQNTIWPFRERLSKTGKDKTLWKEVWRQFKERGITVRNGTIQDATFIESDPGHKRKEKPDMVYPQIPTVSSGNDYPDREKKTKDEMKSASIDERRHSLTRRSKDGSWMKKNSKVHT